MLFPGVSLSGPEYSRIPYLSGLNPSEPEPRNMPLFSTSNSETGDGRETLYPLYYRGFERILRKVALSLLHIYQRSDGRREDTLRLVVLNPKEIA